MARVEPNADGCWIWQGYVDKRGYGRGWTGETAHRSLYRHLRGDFPADYHVDHLCRVTRCVNPEHMEPVTAAENRRRQTAAKTHCKRGHEVTPENRHRNDPAYGRARPASRPNRRTSPTGRCAATTTAAAASPAGRSRPRRARGGRSSHRPRPGVRSRGVADAGPATNAGAVVGPVRRKPGRIQRRHPARPTENDQRPATRFATERSARRKEVCHERPD